MLIAAFFLGSALAAIQLFPFLELLPQSQYFLYRFLGAQNQPWFYAGFWHESAMDITMFFPNIFGNPASGNWWIGTAFGNYTSVLYIGILPLSFAMAGIWVRHKEWRVVFFGMMGLCGLAVISRWPIFDWISRLPLLNIASPSQVVYYFSVAILSGLGWDGLIKSQTVGSRAIRRLVVALGAFACLGGLALGGIYLALRYFKSDFLSLGRSYVENHVYGQPPHPFPLEYYLTQLEDRYRQLLSVFDPARITLYLPLLFALLGAFVLWAIWKGRVQRGFAEILIVTLVVADLWTFGVGFNPTLPPEQVLPRTPALEFMQQRQKYDRITAIGNLLPANTGMAFQLFDVRGYDVGIGRYAILFDRLDHTPTGLTVSERNKHFLDLAGVRYLLSAEDLPAAADVTLVYDREIKIYERRHPLARAYLTGSYQVVTSETSLLTHLDDPEVVAGLRVLLEETPSISSSFTDQPRVGTADIVVYEPTAVTIISDSTQDAMLVLSDAFYPGWRASVDGQETKVYRANFAFRAILVPTGHHTVSFVYRPDSFWAGAWISLGALCILLLGTGVTWWQSRQKRD
jgi:hypothetical protein